MYPYDYRTISTPALIDGCLSVSVSTNAYMYPLGISTISIPAFLAAEEFIDLEGNQFSSIYGEVILTDQNYNRVTTLLCDYYVSPGSASIVYNLFLVNGTRYTTSGIKLMTDSTWSGTLSVQHGENIQYITDASDTTAVFNNLLDPNNAMPIVITVISPGMSVLTIIPIYIAWSE
jgi:hypothetical protein